MSGDEIKQEIQCDLAMLERVEAGGAPEFRTWLAAHHTVVLGRSSKPEIWVDQDFCHRRGIAVLRRPSGGGTVVVGPGTLQYAFALPYSMSAELGSIGSAKSFCNRTLIACLPPVEGLGQDSSGDLVVDGCKVAGLSLKRRRHAMLLHGSILLSADIELITKALRHPPREPAYRRKRPHDLFLANLNELGELDAEDLEARVREVIQRPRPTEPTTSARQ
ncbi:MAG: hypothetical protein VCA74_04495 [Deltaproteobacteria bacterium]